MKNFLRGGRGLPKGQGYAPLQISRHYAAFRPVGNRNVMEISTPVGFIGDNHIKRLLRLSLPADPRNDEIWRKDGGMIVGHTAYSLWPKAFLITFCVLFSLTLAPKALGQGATGLNYDSPLDIGNTIPKELWDITLKVNDQTKENNIVRLADYKGKLIIMDFWATWCATCLESFPKIEALQKQFDAEVQFVLVNALQTKDTEVGIARTLDRIGLPSGIPFLHQDTVFQHYFKHRILPHYVWISPDGKYLGSTSAQEMTGDNIQKALNGEMQAVHKKKDLLDYNPAMPLITYLNAVQGSAIHQSSLFMGRIEGVGNSTGFFTVNNKLSRLYFLNSPLSYLFRMAYRDELIALPNNRLLFDKQVPSGFEQQYLSPQSYDSQYTYEVIRQTSNQTELYNDLKQVLTDHFGVTVFLDTMEIPVWHIIRQTAQIQSGRADSYAMTLGSLVHNINNRFKIPILLDKDLAKNTVNISTPIDSLEFTEAGIEKLIKNLGFAMEKKKEELTFAHFVCVDEKSKGLAVKEGRDGK